MKKSNPKIRKKLLLVVCVMLIGVLVGAYFFRHRSLRFVKNYSTELFEPEQSTLYFPVDIALRDLEKLTNDHVKSVLSDSKHLMENGKDYVYMKVTRTGDFKFKLVNS